jgi:death-on-curing protein
VKEPVWIDEHEAVALHNRLLALDGGGTGVRDQGLLQSAFAGPRQLFADGENPSIVQMDAAYISGIVRNHPFVDGNKRTGFLVGVLFLEVNGREFVATEQEATQAIFSLAAGELDEPALLEWLEANTR